MCVDLLLLAHLLWGRCLYFMCDYCDLLDLIQVDTKQALRKFTADDMKRKVSPQGIEKIRQAGGITPSCEWLLEYWCEQDVAGILLMPPTRHLIFHLNDCCKWKLQIRNAK
jgi:hypothetical protein